jgi:hypothetical protein
MINANTAKIARDIGLMRTKIAHMDWLLNRQMNLCPDELLVIEWQAQLAPWFPEKKE